VGIRSNGRSSYLESNAWGFCGFRSRVSEDSIPVGRAAASLITETRRLGARMLSWPSRLQCPGRVCPWNRGSPETSGCDYAPTCPKRTYLSTNLVVPNEVFWQVCRLHIQVPRSPRRKLLQCRDFIFRFIGVGLIWISDMDCDIDLNGFKPALQFCSWKSRCISKFSRSSTFFSIFAVKFTAFPHNDQKHWVCFRGIKNI